MLNCKKLLLAAFLLPVIFLQQSVKAESVLKCSNYSECKAVFESTAKRFLGSRYSYGSSSKGFDCSGLVLTMVNSLVGKSSLPRSSQDMYRAINQSVSLNDAKMGDLLFFNTGHGVSHVGLYWGKDSRGNHVMYHSSSSKGVEMRPLNGDHYWMSRLVGVKRFSPISQALSGFNKPSDQEKPTAKTVAKKTETPKVNKSSSVELTKYQKDKEYIYYEDDMYQTVSYTEDNADYYETSYDYYYNDQPQTVYEEYAYEVAHY